MRRDKTHDNATFPKSREKKWQGKKSTKSTPIFAKSSVTPTIPDQTPKNYVYIIFKGVSGEKIEELFFGGGVLGMVISVIVGVPEGENVKKKRTLDHSQTPTTP